MKRIVFCIFFMLATRSFAGDLQPVFNKPELQIAPSKTARTPFDQLIEAIHFNKIKAIHDLIEQQPELMDKTDSDNWSALHFAAYFGNLAAVKLLHSKIKTYWFQSGYINKKTTAKKQTPLHLAIMGKHQPVIQYLVEECKADYEDYEADFAIEKGNVDALKYFLPKLGDIYLWTALKKASSGTTSPEVLFYLGSQFKYPLGGKNYLKTHLTIIFEKFDVPIACEFIRGFEQATGERFPYDELLSAETCAYVRDYNQHPEKYVGF